MHWYILRLLFLVFVWWAVAGSEPASWIIGVPAVIGGAFISLYLPRMQSFKVQLGGSIRFILFFIAQAVLAGVDVAARSCRPVVPLAPEIISYKFRLQNAVARIFFIHALSLLPGTLSVQLTDNAVLVHVLDKGSQNDASLVLLESKVAALFGEGV